MEICHFSKKKAIIKKISNEKFTQIPLFENNDLRNYEVSNLGSIRNNKGLIMAQKTNKNGYKTILLTNRKTNKKHLYLVHRLVAFTYIKNNDLTKNVVNHKDKNTSNNKIQNLEWVTQWENNIHGHGIKINMMDLKTGIVIKTFDTMSDANIFLKLSKTNKCINLVCKGLKSSNIAHGYRWSHYDEFQITIQDLLDADSDEK